MCIVEVMKWYLVKYSNLTKNECQKRSVREKQKVFYSNWEQTTVSCEIASNIRSERIFTWRVSNKHGKFHGDSRKAFLKWLKGNQVRNHGGTTGQLPPLKRLCTEDGLHVRNLRKCFLNYDLIEKGYTK